MNALSPVPTEQANVSSIPGQNELEEIKIPSHWGIPRSSNQYASHYNNWATLAPIILR